MSKRLINWSCLNKDDLSCETIHMTMCSLFRFFFMQIKLIFMTGFAQTRFETEAQRNSEKLTPFYRTDQTKDLLQNKINNISNHFRIPKCPPTITPEHTHRPVAASDCSKAWVKDYSPLDIFLSIALLHFKHFFIRVAQSDDRKISWNTTVFIML